MFKWDLLITFVHCLVALCHNLLLEQPVLCVLIQTKTHRKELRFDNEIIKMPIIYIGYTGWAKRSGSFFFKQSTDDLTNNKNVLLFLLYGSIEQCYTLSSRNVVHYNTKT